MPAKLSNKCRKRIKIYSNNAKSQKIYLPHSLSQETTERHALHSKLVNQKQRRHGIQHKTRVEGDPQDDSCSAGTKNN